MMQEQNKLIFNLIYWKFKTKLVGAKEDIRLRRMAIEEELKLWQKLIVNEFETHIVVATATAAISKETRPQKRLIMKKDDIFDEIALKVMNITLQFAGLY